MATPIKKTTTKKAETTTKPAAVKKTVAKTTVKKTSAHTVTHAVAHKEPKVSHVVHHEVEKPEVAVVETVEANITHPTKTSSVLDLKGKYAYAVGRRKTAVANVKLFNGSPSQSEVNKKKLADYFTKNNSHLEVVHQPLRLSGLEKDVYIVAKVNGGGLNAQAAAIAHGISQAIAKTDADFRRVLKKNGLMTRDSRMKERKKPGLKGARRGSQWAKR